MQGTHVSPTETAEAVDAIAKVLAVARTCHDSLAATPAAARVPGQHVELEARCVVRPTDGVDVQAAFHRVVAVLDQGIAWDARKTVRRRTDEAFENDLRVSTTGAIATAATKTRLLTHDLPAAQAVAVAQLAHLWRPPPECPRVRVQASLETPQKQLPDRTQRQPSHTRHKVTHSYQYKQTWRFDVSLVSDPEPQLELEIEALSPAKLEADAAQSLMMKMTDLLMMVYSA